MEPGFVVLIAVDGLQKTFLALIIAFGYSICSG